MEELDDNERLLAAAAHFCVLASLGGIGPLLLFLISADKPFLRYHAGQALVFQFAVVILVIPIALCTFGFGAFLLLPWMVAEVWLGYEAYLGKWTGYPGMSGMFRPE